MKIHSPGLLLLLIAAIVVAYPSQSSSQGFLHAEGVYIDDGNNTHIQLRGMGLGGWLVPEGYMLGTSGFANSPTEIKNKISDLVGAANADQFFADYRRIFVQRKDIDSLARWGFNSVRLPFHYALLSPAQGTYSEDGFALIDSLLAWCEADHIYLILDMHCAPGGQNTINISDYQGWPSLWEEPSYQTWTAELWKVIAQRYASREWIGGYDLLNETAFAFSGGNKPLRDLSVRITDSIRTVDKNHLIFVEGNWYATDFSGLTPTWDNNMAWSFHKYWNSNDVSAFLNFLQLRSSTNAPLWLGESGENSNPWCSDCLFYAESFTIGWSWWTLKKIESISCPLSVTQLPGYAGLLKYWNGQALKPSVDVALKALNDQLSMFDAGRCRVRPDFLDALFRLPFTDDRKPYVKTVLPGPIYLVNYDMGKNGLAYRDIDFENTGGSGGGTYNSGWSYRNDGVDIEASTDPLGNGFDVGWTQAGEFLAFTVDVPTAGTYDIKVRAAASGAGGKCFLGVDGVRLTPDLMLAGTGGWQTWQTNDLGNWEIPAGTHSIEFNEVSGGYNLSRIDFILMSSGVTSSPELPLQFGLSQNFPNPFNPTTVISGQLTVDSWAKLEVYDVLGRVVATLANGRFPAGRYSFTFDAKGLASGMYTYRLTAGRLAASKTMMLIR
ncbi:MAG: cellulase family glycosylhydrolase [Bacteroidota bacterium]